jgi:hypothetical protein
MGSDRNHVAASDSSGVDQPLSRGPPVKQSFYLRSGYACRIVVPTIFSLGECRTRRRHSGRESR